MISIYFVGILLSSIIGGSLIDRYVNVFVALKNKKSFENIHQKYDISCP